MDTSQTKREKKKEEEEEHHSRYHSIHHVGLLSAKKKEEDKPKQSHAQIQKKMKRIYKASDVRDGDGDGLLLIESIDTVAFSLSFLSFHQSKEEEYLFLNIYKNDRFSDDCATVSRNVNARLAHQLLCIDLCLLPNGIIIILKGESIRFWGGVINPGRQSVDDDGQALQKKQSLLALVCSLILGDNISNTAAADDDGEGRKMF